MNAGGERARPSLPDGPYLVVGLARSGQAAARLLAERGEQVLGCDAGEPDGAAELAALGIELTLESDGLALLGRAAALVKSPGVPREAAVVTAALERRVPVLGELELAWRLLPNPFVAVTGTNGKTTVTELLGHVWRQAGLAVEVAGNVGTPLASLVGRVGSGATVICECSSFQLEDTEAFAPECGLLLNVTPDHLDRHRTFAAYLRAKLELFARQGRGDVCVYNGSDPALRGVELGGEGRRIAFCGADAPAGGCRAAVGDEAIELGGERLIGLDELSLPGPHNAANAAAAAAVAEAMGIDREAIAVALATFTGVPHRLERVGERDGVTYVNDSKATNVAAAEAALRSFAPGTVRAILGGSSKGDRFTGLAPAVAERCAGCYLLGDAAGALDRDLAPAWDAGVTRTRCDGLAAAVAAAAADARAGEAVLLAPACASFDTYRDYEQRGEHFRALVAGL